MITSRIRYLLVWVSMALFIATSCSLDTRSAKEIVAQNQRDREAKYYNKAYDNAYKYKIKEYKFLGVEFFQPLDLTRHVKRRETKGTVQYVAKNSGPLFDKIFISTDKRGYVISASGIEYFPDKESAKTFLRKIHSALTPQFPYLREPNEKEDSYSVKFLPEDEYIKSYVSWWMNADVYSRDMQFGYKSTFWYFGNYMPDDKLFYILMDVVKQKNLFFVGLNILSRESVRLSKIDREKEIKEISEELFNSK